MVGVTPGLVYVSLVAAALLGFVVGLYAALWYINRLRRAAGLRTI